MSDVEINGQWYKLGKIDAKTQFHILRRLAPVLGGVAALSGAGNDAALSGIASALAKMPDSDIDYCLDALLSKVYRVVDGGSSPPPVCVGGTLPPDMDMKTMLQLASKVLMENLGSFFSGLPQALSGGNRKLSDPLPG